MCRNESLRSLVVVSVIGFVVVVDSAHDPDVVDIVYTDLVFVVGIGGGHYPTGWPYTVDGRFAGLFDGCLHHVGVGPGPGGVGQPPNSRSRRASRHDSAPKHGRPDHAPLGLNLVVHGVGTRHYGNGGPA